MKRLSDYRGAEREPEDDSPLYASPTAYGYAKVGAGRGGRASRAGSAATPEPGTQPAQDFTFGHTGHMAIILGRGGDAEQTSQPTKHSHQAGRIFENIKEKAKHGFSATKRNF